jgi:hypothetical protein
MGAPKRATANQIGLLAGEFTRIYGDRGARLAAAGAVLELDAPLATFKALTAEQAGRLFGWLSRVERGDVDPSQLAGRHEGAPGAGPAPRLRHGSRSSYNRGCRCQACRGANTDASRRRRAAKGTSAGHPALGGERASSRPSGTRPAGALPGGTRPAGPVAGRRRAGTPPANARRALVAGAFAAAAVGAILAIVAAVRRRGMIRQDVQAEEVPSDG